MGKQTPINLATIKSVPEFMVVLQGAVANGLFIRAADFTATYTRILPGTHEIPGLKEIVERGVRKYSNPDLNEPQKREAWNDIMDFFS